MSLTTVYGINHEAIQPPFTAEFWQTLQVRESGQYLYVRRGSQDFTPGRKFQDQPQWTEGRRGSLAKWIPTSQGSHVLWSPDYSLITVEKTIWEWKWRACRTQVSFKESPEKSFQNKCILPGERGWAFQNGWGRAGHKKWKPILKKDLRWYWSHSPIHCETTDLFWNGTEFSWDGLQELKTGQKLQTKCPVQPHPKSYPFLKVSSTLFLGKWGHHYPFERI